MMPLETVMRQESSPRVQQRPAREVARAQASQGLRTLIAARRKGAKAVGQPPVSPNEEQTTAGDDIKDKTFHGGFFSVSSPMVTSTRPARLATRSPLRLVLPAP